MIKKFKIFIIFVLFALCICNIAFANNTNTQQNNTSTSSNSTSDTYVGNINTEIKSFKLAKDSKKNNYVYGEIVVVEWVNR